MTLHKTTDILVIGGGIIGLAIARSLRNRMPQISITLVEKEAAIAMHQSSHSSNVIHAGIYYKPDSLKAQLCTKGVPMVYEFCSKKSIPINKCGKLIVATDYLEAVRLKVLCERGLQNGLSDLVMLKTRQEMEKVQPFCGGVCGLWSPQSATVDWAQLTRALGEEFTSNGGEILLNSEVQAIKDSPHSTHPLRVELANNPPSLMAKYVVVSTGLQSGQLLESLDNNRRRHKTVSFRVNYSLLDPSLSRFVHTNIYSLPHIELPFLGCHISPLVDGKVAMGPSAVPALKREDYAGDNVDFDYLWNILNSKGFLSMLAKNVSTSWDQYHQSTCNDTRAATLKKYLPMISKSDILPGQRSVQTQLIDDNGNFVDDYIIESFEGRGIRKRIVNCRFVPSPGATSCLAIGEMIADKMTKVYVDQ